jgi:hypothetical protein
MVFSVHCGITSLLLSIISYKTVFVNNFIFSRKVKAFQPNYVSTTYFLFRKLKGLIVDED